jgi:serine O-acetyltransferase
MKPLRGHRTQMSFDLLRADLERQYSLEGKIQKATCWQMIKRLPSPRFLPLVLCRYSRTALLRGVPGLPYILSYLNLILFGLHVTPKCEIGPGLFFPHTMGTVLGAWKLGSNVTVFQNVTLGAKIIDMAFDRTLLPIIGDNVTIGAGAKVLGGIVLGNNVTVGSNAVVVHSIEANCTVVGVPARKITPAKHIELGSD